ncbi:MAG: class I SAM-dependent methyltransferase [Christensenella sp.]
MNEQYSVLARIYDKLMYDVSYEVWADYIIKLLHQNAVEHGAAVLEYACGTGNITLPLAREGYHVTAMDASEEMLFCAQEKTRKSALQVNYACNDMQDFRLNKSVKAAVCACDGVNYLLQAEDLQRFFENAYKNLDNQGVFLFDISSAYKLRHILGNEFYYDDGENETYFWQNSFDEQSSIVKMELTLFAAKNGLYERYDEIHLQRAWEQSEIEIALKKAGFSEITAYGFGTTKPPCEKDERIQFMAIRGEKVNG